MTSQTALAARPTEAASGRRILQVVASSWAIPFQIQPLAEALVSQGWGVDIASPAGPEAEGLAARGIRHRPIPLARNFATLQHVSGLNALIRLMREGRYDLVHLHGPIASMLGRVAAKSTGVPVIYHCRGTYYEDTHALWSEQLARKAYPLLERALAPWTDWTFTLTPQDASDLIAKAKFKPDTVESLGVGGCGLDLKGWSATPYDEARKAELRARFGVPQRKRIVGFVGRLVTSKGIFELLEAFTELRRTRPDIHLLVVGDTEAGSREPGTGERFRQNIIDAGLSEAVTLTGHLSKPVDAVALMDLLTLPSYSESFGQVLIEAGAMGLPVVAAENRGSRFSVADGETGILVPPRDAGALAEALGRLLDDPALAARMGEAGLTRSKVFSRERVIGRMTEVYEHLVARRSRA